MVAICVTQLVARFLARQKRASIGVSLAIFRSAQQGAVADLQLGTGLCAARACSDGAVDQQPGGFTMWGADHVLSSARARPSLIPPRSLKLLLLKKSSAVALARAFSVRASSRFRPWTRFFRVLVA